MEAPLPQLNGSARPWVEIVSPHDVVVTGLRGILEAALGVGVVVTAGSVEGEPDVVLYDVIGLLEGDTSELDHWVKDTDSTVVAVSRDLRPDLACSALAHGAQAVMSLGVEAHELAEVVAAAVTGNLDEVPAVRDGERCSRLGASAGLSDREADVLRLIVSGVSNQTIARTLFLSINSVKTYIRSTYRKVGVDNRAQAVAWGLAHGFAPPTEQIAPMSARIEQLAPGPRVA
jgi:DNA-binding NarL/FixJ family response regulator